jgi:F-type H+-transporting ATPase subunit b
VIKRVSLLIAFVAVAACAFVTSAAQEQPKAEPSRPTAESISAADAAHGADASHAAKTGAHEATPDTGGHASHVETDLSHGNSTAALKSPTDVRFDMAIYTFVLFLILLAVLYKFAWGPIASALEQREETIARQIEEARLASEKAALQLKEYEARLAAATDEARLIVAQARKDAESAKDKIVAEARDAAGKERDRAVAEIHVAKNQALDEIAQKSVQMAINLAGNIIRREVKPQEHEALIGEAVNQFENLN